MTPAETAAYLDQILAPLHERYRTLNDGEVATYIPELAKANPGHFGICLTTLDGVTHAFGDCDQEFTIQSISKPLVYGMALAALGREGVHKKVGVEPTGDAFNAIILDEKTRRPFNPMVNAGAIATAALVPGKTLAERRESVLATFSAAAGRRLSIDEKVYQSELETGHRNRAIAHLMLNFGMIEGDVTEILDLYFMQCSILVNCRDLAMIGATLANVGTNPVTKEHVFETASVQDVLSVMFTCGMYDYAGEWAVRVGIPAKSGVAGGILAVINRQFGIGTYSPRLDAQGNSLRGIKACADLADELGLHAFNFMNSGSQFMKSVLPSAR
jgi:glutaminase